MAYASSTLRTVYTTEPSIVTGPIYVERARPRSSCNSIPVLTKLAFAILLFTNIIYVFVFATPVWITSHRFQVGRLWVADGTAGLWSECGRVGVNDICLSLVTGSSGVLIAAEVFASLAVLTSFLALFTLIAYLLLYTCGRKRLYAILVFSFIIITALLIMVALSIYGARVVGSNEVLAWVFALCACADVLYFLAAIFLLPELITPYERRAFKQLNRKQNRPIPIHDASMESTYPDEHQGYTID